MWRRMSVNLKSNKQIYSYGKSFSKLCGDKGSQSILACFRSPSNSAVQVMKAFDCGWGGAVWKTIGAQVVNVSSRYSGVNWGKKRLVGLSNIELISDRSVSDNLKEIETVKKQFPHHPVIASVMVQTRRWIRIIQDCRNAGVDGIELNFGCPHGMCERGMESAVGQEPKLVELITRWVTEEAKVPVIVKLTPNITDITEPASATKRGWR